MEEKADIFTHVFQVRSFLCNKYGKLLKIDMKMSTLNSYILTTPVRVCNDNTCENK